MFKVKRLFFGPKLQQSAIPNDQKCVLLNNICASSVIDVSLSKLCFWPLEYICFLEIWSQNVFLLQYWSLFEFFVMFVFPIHGK